MDCLHLLGLPAVPVRAAAGSLPAGGCSCSINRHQRRLLGRQRLGLGALSHRRSPELTETTLVKGLSGEG